MATEREIVRFKQDVPAARALAASLLAREDLDCSDVGRDILESIAARSEDDPPSHRQIEVLLSIRDESQYLSVVGDGLSVRLLIARLREASFDLDDSDAEWIERLASTGATAVKRRQAGRLLRLAHNLGFAEAA